MGKTAILGTIVIFYAVFGLLIGLFGGSFTEASADTLNPTFSFLGLTFTLPSFLGNIVTGVIGLGWLNIILWTPLIIVLTWIILTSFIPTTPGSD